MLKLDIPERETFNEETQEFYTVKHQTLTLEHSLLSISKWESKWHVPYLHEDKRKPKTSEMQLDYIRCMTIGTPADDIVYYCLTSKDIQTISDYINNPMTASTFPQQAGKGGSREIVTSELIYYWMVEFGIPFECEKWHLNRLMTLIRACEVHQGNVKKMNKKAIWQQNEELNRMRRARLHSKG